MKICKNFLCLILALTMLFVLLAGCSSQKDNSVGNTAFSYSDGIDENGFFKGIKALKYVELFNYQALPIPKGNHQVSEDSLQTEIDNILAYYSHGEQIKDRAVVNGDTVNIDYVGSVDGVEFAGGSTSGSGTDVTIGITSYIDDFLEQLIGHMPGETINVEVTFPDAYQEVSLQGKDAVFVTTINYIVETVKADLTDDFVKTNLSASYGWETVAEMKEDISADLQKKAIEQYINEYLYNKVTIRSVPDKLTKYQEKAMLEYYRSNAEYYGMEFEAFLTSYMGVSSTDELIETNRDSISKNAMYALTLQAVAEDAGISVNEGDMIDYLTDYSAYEEQYGLPYLKQVVLFQKTVDYIVDHAVLE